MRLNLQFWRSPIYSDIRFLADIEPICDVNITFGQLYLETYMLTNSDSVIASSIRLLNVETAINDQHKPGIVVVDLLHIHLLQYLIICCWC